MSTNQRVTKCQGAGDFGFFFLCPIKARLHESLCHHAVAGHSLVAKTSLYTENRLSISGLFNGFHFFPEESISDVGWAGVGRGWPGPQRHPPSPWAKVRDQVQA